jgi:hypothetical protein
LAHPITELSSCRIFQAWFQSLNPSLDISNTLWQNREVGMSVMKSPIIPQPVLLVLIAIALLLPMAITVIMGVGQLLSAMGDVAGGVVLGRIGLALGILWGLDLVILVVGLAVQSLGDNSHE